MIEENHPQIPVARQCELLGIARSTYYHELEPETELNQRLMHEIDETYLAYPYFGSRQMTAWLRLQGHKVNRKRIQRLMRLMGLEGIAPSKKTSMPHPEHRVFPYLLKGLEIVRPNQVWAADITYVPVRGGHAYLCAVIDWYSRKVLAWELSNTLDASFCVRCLKRAIAEYGGPEIFNTDQGCQFTSADFVQLLLQNQIKVSMDGKGRWVDNVMVERLWRSLKHEEVYLKRYESLVDAHAQIERYLAFYNERRPHSAHEGKPPSQIYAQPQPKVA